ncbi:MULTISPECIES: sporulation peptidase YabG [Metabacillus]|uniref:Sporulation peptidase YabG n=1 Tax=Metabacillus hrfriensis TaxID=3048891 RepID=A0ACD4RBN5_9BACI|nr:MULTISPECIES: sporulation peptidase YabG [Metabacillus]UAL52370.1 sporulation peptidase YabG [Metabacillus dongyingensis]UOK58097.1 sporulation peptidase YabG [Bacillus sp. OVS6]USK28681.1 sporulation peptidase YabG [Bacillus sp. CMF21]WHZ57898.1 sporulation peptidase YabG [Metabacillus sp. CT-WN-B3]
MQIKIGDIVARKSYKYDVLFRVIDLKQAEDGTWAAILYGEEVRLIADALCDDLAVIGDRERNKRKVHEKEMLEQSLYLLKQDYRLLQEKREYGATASYSHNEEFFHLPGKVLHLDGDPLYLQKCLTLYERVGVPVFGVHVKETEMQEVVTDLIEEYRPNILVITGHDSYSKHKGSINDLNAYRHSKHFVQTVRNARKAVPHLDQLVIFAGACQSHFESLISAGANFASSPSRVNIHALDPVYIVAKISFTPFMERINVWDVLRNTLTREKGLGGVETKGVLRTGMPYHRHEDSNS